MTIWEKSVVNMQKGVQKIVAFAAVFSERVKAEIAIVRLRIKIDDIQKDIARQYQVIGQKVVDLKNGGDIPKTTEQLLNDETISSALSELIEQKKEVEELLNEIRIEQEAFATVRKQKEDSSL